MTGRVVDTAASNGGYVGAPFTAADERLEAQRLGRAFRQKFQQVPDANAALAYDATRLIAAAIEAYNQSKSRDVSDYNMASQWKRYGRQKSMRN